MPPVHYEELIDLCDTASGPFSYRGYQGIAYTAYPLPDGQWNWADCPASEWVPELAGYLAN